MKLSFAPLEGVTDYPFRNAHYRCFGGADLYYTPFLSANSTHSFKKKEKREVLPELNRGIPLIPQILSNDPDAFVWASVQMAMLGYREVNLNLGCPSPAVTGSGRGAAMIADPDGLDRFLDAAFRKLEEAGRSCRVPVISAKTRSGASDRSETPALITVFNRYPFSEIIVHPRLKKELYRGKADWDAFEMFYVSCTKPLAYSGDIRTVRDAERFMNRFPGTGHIMIGRGAVADPAIFRELKGGSGMTSGELSLFHDAVLGNRLREMHGFDRAAGGMKELWFYWKGFFPCGEEAVKGILRSRGEEAYRKAVSALFENSTSGDGKTAAGS